MKRMKVKQKWVKHGKDRRNPPESYLETLKDVTVFNASLRSVP